MCSINIHNAYLVVTRVNAIIRRDKQVAIHWGYPCMGRGNAMSGGSMGAR